MYVRIQGHEIRHRLVAFPQFVAMNPVSSIVVVETEETCLYDPETDTALRCYPPERIPELAEFMAKWSLLHAFADADDTHKVRLILVVEAPGADQLALAKAREIAEERLERLYAAMLPFARAVVERFRSETWRVSIVAVQGITWYDVTPERIGSPLAQTHAVLRKDF